MNAKRDDLSRVQEIYDVVCQTQRQISSLGFNKERFVDPQGDEDDLIAEGILNRVLRITEEAGHIDDDKAMEYGFDRHAVLGVRNRLAHAYGEVDREIIWSVIDQDFDALLKACVSFCEDNGADISESSKD